MKLNRIAKKLFAIFSVLLLILCLKISTNVSAKLIKDEDYGIAYDEFEDSSSIIMVNCTLNETTESVILKYEPLSIVYNHNKKPNNIEAWYDDQALIFSGDLLKFLTTITNPNLLKKYEFTDLSGINAIDDNYLETESLVNIAFNYTYYPIHIFEIKIDENFERLENFKVNWVPGSYNKDANVENITMYLWSYGDFIPHWNNIGVCKYTEDNFNLTKGEIYSEESARTYISQEGIIDILIIAEPIPNMDPKEPATLTTDFVEVELSTQVGFNPNGYIISDIIEPSKFHGWESIIWESTKPTDDTYVKLQILDINDNPLSEDELKGNTNGFLISSIDLSSLGSSHPKIKLKAILHSEKYDITPRLYSWAILWQTVEGFFDIFTYDFRIKESNGVKIENGDITISDFYTDWPIFGKNPSNTRSYTGIDVKYEGNKTYWQTFINKDIGGWFRSPIMSNGRVYIGANDNRIYAFNLSLDPVYGDETEYYPLDESSANYNVETSVAVSDGNVIFGTSTLDSNNKIYALNSTDLSSALWNYSINDKTICFSAAPTIANGNVYITSWTGQFANITAVSYLYSKINVISGYRLGLNNKLIALDLKNGNPIWDPINLPAASLSTPAVDDGLIFVGCENIGGPSLFAYDEDMGNVVWNASVGTIGRASPVVAQGENGKIVIVVAREQNLFSFKGTDKVFALNAENGSILWNFTIGNESSLTRIPILIGMNFTHVKATEPPAATPAVSGNIVYVMASNGNLYALDINTGEEKWRFEDSSTMFYHSASPVVVNDIIYVLSQASHLYELNALTGELILDYDIIYEGYTGFLGYLYSSPIVTDGLIVISNFDYRVIDDEYYGHLMCLGELTNNTIGNVYSIPIHVQKGKWWDTFNAGKIPTNSTVNTITFSILDENGNKLKTGLNGINNDISGIKKNIIQIYGELKIGNASITLPVLQSWKITWKIEDKKPEFINNSFRSGEGREGWVNLNLSECSIDVKDIGVGGITSGLDTDSAQYLLEYVKKGSNNVVSEWFDAVCDGEPGALSTKITAKISEDLKNIEVTDLKNISFSIKDLAGNVNKSKTITFKIDSIKPSSEIKDIESFKDRYNSNVLISAEGEDDKSGVVSIALYYRFVGDKNWSNKEESDQAPYNWLFRNDISGDYEFCTISTDKAGNVKDFPDEGELSFLFDMNKPYKPEFKEEYRFNKLPQLSDIIFEDDFKLKSAEYRLNFHGTEEWINISNDIDDKIYNGEWSLSKDDWDNMLEDVTYYMYFRLTDICGNQYIPPSDYEALKIIKDVTPPIANVTLDLFNFEEGGWDDAFTIIADIPIDIEFDYINLEYIYSADNSKWNEWETYGESINRNDTPYEWDFKAKEGSGYYKFKVELWDAAGNYVESLEKNVNVTLFPTSLVSLMIILIFIFLIVIAFVIKKMKKRKE
jgi:outer membrane protein assembly factor BamB